MRFAFTDDQLAFAEGLRELLARECGPDAVRTAWEAPDGRVPGLWARLVDLGVVGLLAPEGVGGMGLTEVDLVLLLAEAGRAALPEPLGDVAMVAVPALRDHAHSDDAEAWLERITAGEATVAVRLAPDTLVGDAERVGVLLLEDADGLHLVDRDVVELEPVHSVDGARRMARLSWTPSPATAMAGGPAAARQARDRAALAAAAELVGLADRMLEMTVGYAAERRQFGAPIGSFQAVKHLLADATLAVEFAKPLVWRAADSMAHEDPAASVHASMAKASASDAARQAAEASLQCHGAIGYTVEYDLHLSMKRAWALVRRAGDARYHRRRVAAALLDG